MERTLIGGCLLAGLAEAFIISGKSTPSATLFSNQNVATLTAGNEFVAGPAISGSVASDELKWTIKNLSWIDEDTGKEYLEITNTLTMPILSTDKITFHVEFYEGDAEPTNELYRDGFECIMSKDLTTANWNVSAKDIYIRADADGNQADSLPQEDFQTNDTNGQDWFVFETDAESDSNLCTTSGSGDFQCSKIKCILRREMDTGDPDDFVFAPSASSTPKMTFPAGRSYILMNQEDASSARKRLRTLADAQIEIKEGASSGIASFLAASAALFALSAF